MKLFKYNGTKIVSIVNTNLVTLNTSGLDNEVAFVIGSRMFECEIKVAHKLLAENFINLKIDNVLLAETYLPSTNWLESTVISKNIKLANNQNVTLKLNNFNDNDIISVIMTYTVTLFIDN
ncbi:hypothetical protein VB834_09215 [Limnoraphis robusta Tam1]|uniref:Uncharacterized protein n=1 Tax=Limnoraphis robusta CCNP1315 TaxID=3110306 RepID=A0ABU5TXA4_9CYAN|nr:hypothetical protein [Limnoraphis robusta]MEA5500370.1 hypothetical protein [Limnoraphis robusta BA-68 BA1]MEA5519548.1 hypothetical protein [Limnoraphis robusta CCNP1315]MEA5539212.1 hypothetical protein [Limnoraphis robusta Tam1]MEA5545816.1 hypothetical protein [Limnoraphis robusta CCNP1324]